MAVSLNAVDSSCKHAIVFKSLTPQDKPYAIALAVWAPTPARILGEDFRDVWGVSTDRAKQLIQTFAEVGLIKRDTDSGDFLKDLFFTEPEAAAFFETLED